MSLLAGSACGALLQPRPTVSRRCSRVARRRHVAVTAFWPQGGRRSEDEMTDEEVFTAAALNNPRPGRRGSRSQEAKQAVEAPGGPPPDEPAGRPSPAQFAAAFSFVTLGAFVIGAAARKYIFQPSGGSSEWSIDLPAFLGGGGMTSPGKASPGKGGGDKGRRKKDKDRGRAAPPSAQAVPAAAPSAADALRSSAAVAASREQRAAASAPAVPPAAEAAAASEAAPPAAAAPAAAAAAAPAAAAERQEAAPAGATSAAQAAAPATQPPAAEAPQQQAQPGKQPAAGTARLESWCETTLEPAAAAAGSKAAAEAAAPLLACPRLWVVAQDTPQGPQLLRLQMPVPGGAQERCLVLFQDEADALAACSTLARVWGLPAAAQRRATADLLRDAASSSWGAAFYAAGSLQDALAAVDDAAVRQELLESMGAMGPAAEADEQPPAPDEMLFDVLTQQALVLGAASAREAARAAAAAAEAARHRKAAERQQRQAAKLREQAAAAQLQVASAQQQVPERQHEAAVRAGAPAAPPPVVPAAAWDPTAEKLPLRHATPDWWLTLPVLHVPQLVYADGSKGLMSVRVRAPQAAGSPPASASNGSGSSGGGSGGGSSAEGAQVLVAFADGKDAEALADCLLTEPTCPRAIQLISVPPEQLRKHAQANACGVATLPVGALVLPPGLEYAHAVFLVAEAAELQWRLQAAAADVQRSGGGKAA